MRVTEAQIGCEYIYYGGGKRTSKDIMRFEVEQIDHPNGSVMIRILEQHNWDNYQVGTLHNAYQWSWQNVDLVQEKLNTVCQCHWKRHPLFCKCPK